MLHSATLAKYQAIAKYYNWKRLKEAAFFVVGCVTKDPIVNHLLQFSTGRKNSDYTVSSGDDSPLEDSESKIRRPSEERGKF